MDYLEHPAGPRLAAYVDRFWTLSGSAEEMTGVPQPVLPDGRPELIIHFADPFERATDARFERQARMLFAGQLTEQLVLRPTGAATVLGVRFHPFGARAFIDVPMDRLAGATPAVEEVSTHLARELASVTSATGDALKAVPLVRQMLERLVRRDRIDPRVRAAAGVMIASAGLVSIERIAATIGTSRRHLERRFLDAVGISPKRLARITRFHGAVQVLQSGNHTNGAATAAQFGYADQPHFIRDFRELAGCTPAEHLVRQAELTGFFVTGAPLTKVQ